MNFGDMQTDCFLDKSMDPSSKDNARRWMVESLCIPILESAAISLIDRYFQKYAPSLFKIICGNVPDFTKNQDTVRLELLHFECAYTLLAMQYKRLHRISVEKIAGCDFKKVIITAKKHVRLASAQSKKEVFSQTAFHCAAYECMAHCIMCTQKEGKVSIWNNLFMDVKSKKNPNPKKILWSNIIDCNLDLVLSIDTSWKYDMRRITRKILQSDSNSRRIGDGASTQSIFSHDPQALISRSSLQHDFESLSVGDVVGDSNGDHKEAMMEDDNDMELNGDAMDLDDEEKEAVDEELVLELDPLNAMPVMNSMLNTLDALNKHFSDKEDGKKIYKNGKGEWSEAMPDWMRGILQTLRDEEQHQNIHYFIAKLILNRPLIFEPFAADFFEPLVDLFVTESVNNWGFHYFLRDICELFLFKWKSFVPDSMLLAAQRFINHCILCVADFGDGISKTRKVQQNVNFVKLLLVKWKDIETVDKQHIKKLLSVDIKWKQDMDQLAVGNMVLMQYTNRNETASKVIPCQIVNRVQKGDIISYRIKLPGNRELGDVQQKQFRKRDLRLERRAGLWIIDALIEANFPAFNPTKDVVANISDPLDVDVFFSAFCSNFACRSKPVWKTASKVFGDLLRKEFENEQNDPQFIPSFSETKYVEQIKKIIKRTVRDDLPKAIEMMQRIAVEYPKFLDYDLLKPVLGSLGHTPISCLTDSVSLFAKYVADDVDPEVAIWLRPGMRRIFDHNDVDAHSAVCDIFLRLIQVIDRPVIEEYLPQFIEHFKDHRNKNVRRKLLGILCHIYDNVPELNPVLREKVKETLLAALADPNTTNRKLMFEFWGNPTRLNENMVDRMEDLMTKMFVPGTEHLWIHYASFLLLEPMRQSTSFKESISHRPLSECRFEDMDIVTDGGMVSLTQNFGAMTPMFTNSLPSSQKPTEIQQTMLSLADLANGTQPQMGYVRATQQAVWTQTQMEDVRLPTPTDAPETGGYGSGKNQTFLWTQNVVSSLEDDGNDGLQELFAGSYAEFQQGPKPKKLRIVQPTMSDRFSGKSTRKRLSSRINRYDINKRNAKAFDALKRESAANSVSLYRKYRSGELPDIQMPRSGVQLPLQALHTDPVIAKKLLIMLFQAIYAESIGRSDRQHNYQQQIESAMTSLLEQCNNEMASTVMLCANELKDLKIDPKVIGDLALRSGHLYSGVVLLEKLLSNGESVESQRNPKKRRRLNSDESKEQNVLSFRDKIHSQLTRLYNLLNEQDTVLALSSNFAKMQETKDGLQSYMKGNYWDSYHSYLAAQTLANQQGDRCTASILEKTLWAEESAKCLHKLAKWDIVYDSTMKKLQSVDRSQSMNENLWMFLKDKDDLDLTEQSTMESWFRDWFKSSVKKGFEVDSWMRSLDETQQKYVEGQFSAELAFLYSTQSQRQFTKSDLHRKKAYEMILDQWTSLPRFAYGAKKVLLSQLQKLVEIEEFSNIIKMECDADSEDILSFWKQRYPKHTDDVLIWDDVSFSRKTFGRVIERLDTADYLKELVTDCQVDTLYESIRAMIYQKNYTVAEHYMSEAALLGSLTPRFNIQHLRLKLNAVMDNDQKSKKEKLQTIQQLNERLKNFGDNGEMNDFEHEMALLKGEMLFQIAELANSDGALMRYVNGTRSVLDVYKWSREEYRKSLATFLDDDEVEMKDILHEDGNGNRNDKRRDNDPQQKAVREHEVNLAKAHMELAQFCNRRLLSMEEAAIAIAEAEEHSKLKVFSMIREYSKLEIDLGQEFIENVLKSMAYNSEDARDLFPRVLETAVMDVKVLGPLVQRLSAKVPTWMFLRWIPQMLAELGATPGLRQCVMEILQRIAVKYPGALLYPFNLSSEDLADDKSVQKYIEKLKDSLESMSGYELTAAFTEAMECMCHPNLKFSDYRKDTQVILKDKRTGIREKRQKVAECIKDMMYDLFTESKKYVKKLIGTENERFMRLYRKAMIKEFGANGEKVAKRSNVNDIPKFLQKVERHKDFKTFAEGKKSGGKVELRMYSEWLACFDASQYSEVLYVPGQFTGMRKPDMSRHLEIMSFDGITLIMGSLRKPKRIKLRTNDEREQMWLAKAGEDLRMDERVEQILKISNTILCKNAHCVEKNLVLRTYDVIPLNRSTGMLEWIPNTIPIKALVEGQMKKHKVRKSWKQIVMEMYIAKLMKVTRESHGAKMYMKAIEQCAAERPARSSKVKQIVDSFHQCQQMLPQTTLQGAIVDMAQDNESFIKLRSRFCKTLSVYTLVGYILGIGDRHLDNYLVDESTGQVIGIDFGAAFGYGLGLPVPELMPCRLTRQFMNLMHPLNTKIHIRNFMCTVMTALREKKDNLLNVMNVFVKEPSLDWMDLAMKNFEKSDAKKLIGDFESLSLNESSVHSSDLMWYPRHKIYIAKLKLNLYTSTYVMKEEIKSTQHWSKEKVRKAMEVMINGWGDDKDRKMFTKEQCDSVQDQIDCLIDHADDDNILAITWQGWGSWV